LDKGNRRKKDLPVMEDARKVRTGLWTTAGERMGNEDLHGFDFQTLPPSPLVYFSRITRKASAYLKPCFLPASADRFRIISPSLGMPSSWL